MTTSDHPLKRPAGRYDETKPLTPTRLAALGALLVAVLVAFSALAYQQYASKRIPFANTGYQVVDDHSVRVDFSVSKERGSSVQCRLQARDRLNTEVGTVVVRLGPDLAGTVDQSATITTSARAAAGVVLSCRPAP
jgi:hypothetical protein